MRQELIPHVEQDPVILTVIAKVDEMQYSPLVVSGKKIKITQQMIECSYQKLRSIMNGKKVDTQSVVSIVAYALQIANEMLRTSKTYKIELALAIIRKLIDDELDVADQQRMVLHMLVESAVPTLIDTIDGLPSLFSKCCGKKA